MFGLPHPAYRDDPLNRFCGPGEVAVRLVLLSRDGNRIAGTGDPPQGLDLRCRDVMLRPTAYTAPNDAVCFLD